MRYIRTFLVFGLLIVVVGGVCGQDNIKPDNIPNLNRIAEEYDYWKWVLGIATAVLAIWSFFGLKFFVKTKAEEWVLAKIAKEAELKIENLKSAIGEFARIADFKKRKILVISAEEGQQANVKKVFDGCGFAYEGHSWITIGKVPTLVLGEVDVLLFNDQPDLPLSIEQIESVMEKFKTNVGYFYFGDKILTKSAEYRKTMKIDLDFCNSITRLEAGLISLLKIR